MANSSDSPGVNNQASQLAFVISRKTAKAVASGSPQLIRGQVVGVDEDNSTVDLQTFHELLPTSGSGPVTQAKYLTDSYSPRVGDTVSLIKQGGDNLVLGRTSDATGFQEAIGNVGSRNENVYAGFHHNQVTVNSGATTQFDDLITDYPNPKWVGVSGDTITLAKPGLWRIDVKAIVGVSFPPSDLFPGPTLPELIATPEYSAAAPEDSVNPVVTRAYELLEIVRWLSDRILPVAPEGAGVPGEITLLGPEILDTTYVSQIYGPDLSFILGGTVFREVLAPAQVTLGIKNFSVASVYAQLSHCVVQWVGPRQV